MPLTHSEPDALSRVYASALFDLAIAQGGQPTIEHTLAELEELLDLSRSEPAFGEFLASRILAAESRGKSLERILTGRVSDLTRNFLLTLNAKGRLSSLPGIIAAFDEKVQEAFGRVEVDVYTASPISPEDLSAIRERLRATLGKDPIVHPYTDRAMIGGLKLQIGDQLIDASIATRLRKMRDRLNEDGMAKLRARADRMMD
ncbi:MAG: ATP synthase F1 subunit delta [Phycisphaeraceae bacterium]|nr:ATP synthase F1 subunit delta [Phycisphaeraceae bacterium]MBX3407916.1 ATP synthase F1 subunit delta [Phycisphaeraceae bacterium]